MPEAHVLLSLPCYHEKASYKVTLVHVLHPQIYNCLQTVQSGVKVMCVILAKKVPLSTLKEHSHTTDKAADKKDSVFFKYYLSPPCPLYPLQGRY